MAIELIAKIKPKNNGSFAMVDAQDVEFEDGRRLDAVINSIGYTDADFTPVFENLTPTFTEVEGVAGEPSGQFSTVLDNGVPLEVGAIYKVVWDGKERICKCFDETNGGGVAVTNIPMIGNSDIVFTGGYGNGEEFLILSPVTNGVVQTTVVTTAKGETHTISLYIFEKASELPKVTEEDNDKVLKVVDGHWQAATGGGGFVASAEPPEDTSLLWIDTDDDTGEQVYSKEQIDNKLKSYATTAAVDTKLKSYAKTEDIPEKLPNPYALTINGTSYDGSEAKTISITTDLSGYYTKTEVDAALGAYITDIDTLLGGDS